jgi:hypothetical protein
MKPPLAMRRLAFVSDIDGNVLELIGPADGPEHG